MRKVLITATLMSIAAAWTLPAFADSDPSMHQIYDEARAGHLDQAQTMINEVLRDHPNSGKAHYVAAELAAREGKASVARTELATADRLAPGLPFAKPQSLQALRAEIGLTPGVLTTGVESSAPRARPFPWGMALVFVGAIVALWMLFRRRSSYPQYPGGALPATGPGQGPGYYGPGAGPMAGTGSGIMGGLASGLAVGAGVVAGEELAHHFLDGGRRDGGTTPSPIEENANPDMGGSDFGVNDASSWDDGGSMGGDSGGGDWS